MRFFAGIFAISIFATTCSHAEISFQFPTENRALREGKPEEFYMHVNRFNEKKENLRPWQGGCYGIVRTPLDVGLSDKVCTKFHEGIDIRPIFRDERGRPKDEVRPMMKGIVVHVTPNNGNYGKYVVVRHDTQEGSIFTLYAHLATTNVQVGDVVGTGNVLGILGFTGAGIDCERAHVHVEACLMLNPSYDKFHEAKKLGVNRHGIYHGWNFVGMDVAAMLQESEGGKSFRVSDFLKSQEVEYKVLVPSHGKILEICQRYPWLMQGEKNDKIETGNPSWEISFTFAGVPTSVVPSDKKIEKPEVSWVRSDVVPVRYRTCKRVIQKGEDLILTASGRTLIALISGEGISDKQEDEHEGQEG